MKSKLQRAGTAALALVVCLSLAPIATAARTGGGFTAARSGDGFDLRERITKIIKKLKGLPGIWVFEDTPGPPKP